MQDDILNLTFPKSWNDLSHTQLKNISHQLESYHTLVKDSPEVEAINATTLYFQLSKEILRHNPWRSIRIALKEIQPIAFKTFTEFLFKNNTRTNFIEKVKINGVKYYAPAPRLRNSTIAEFAFIDAAYYKWKQTHNNIWLSVLCAAMYREATPELNEIDIRKPFIKQAVDVRADAFQTLDIKTRLAIAYTYEGCRQHIANTFPLIFPKPIITEDSTALNQKYVGFGEIILDKIEGDPSKLQTTNNVMLYDFLAIYNTDIKKLSKK